MSTQNALPVFGVPQVASGNTKTYGGVVRPFKGWRALDSAAERGSPIADAVRSLSFHYNKSDNFSPSGVATDFYGSAIPFPTGQGKDWGVGVSLFNNKVVARLNWFEASAENARGGLIGQSLSRTITIDDVMFRTWAQWATGSATNNSAAVNGILRLPANIAATTPGGFFDPVVAANATTTVEAEGLEFQLTYNPTNNWTFKFNAGKQETIFSNIGPQWDVWVAAPPDADGLVRSLDVNRPVYSGEEFHVDAWVAYSFRGLPWIGDKVRTKVQLNVRDALENGGLLPIAVNPDGQKIAFRIVEPRQWFLTATLEF